jgi:hypothetical protein
MSKGIVFDFRPRVISAGQILRPGPPFNQSGQMICGTFAEPGFSPPIVAFMHDYYSVSAAEQRQMAQSTILLCEMMYQQQEVNNV